MHDVVRRILVSALVIIGAIVASGALSMLALGDG
jgi:hypothetical protein